MVKPENIMKSLPKETRQNGLDSYLGRSRGRTSVLSVQNYLNTLLVREGKGASDKSLELNFLREGA